MANVKKVRARKLKKSEVSDEVILDEIKEKKMNDKKINNNDKNSENKAKKVIKETKSIVPKKKVGTRKIRMSLSRAEEKKMDKEIEQSDNMSMGVIVFILVICFAVGITLGYFLYKIAINGAL